ncbi:MAG: FHA domain-containing protein [Vicinamibacteria bacterium]
MSSISPAHPQLSAELRCQLRPGRVESFRLSGGEIVLGRSSEAGVKIAADGVSRRHARITLRDGAYWLENLSQAGTFLNVHRDRGGRLAGLVVRPRRLRHLDVITLAKSVDLLFLLFAEERPRAGRVGVRRALLMAQEGEAPEVDLGVGETTIGRSSAANVVLEASVVSSLHARIERDAERVVLRDLDSANGTFLNRERVTTALLRDGDVVSFAKVVSFRVTIEMGEFNSGEYRVFDAGALGPGTQRPVTGVYSQQWKTRYEWNSAEMKEIADLRARIEQRVAQKAQAGAAQASPRPADGAKAAAKPSPPKAAPAPASPTAPLPKLPAAATAPAPAKAPQPIVPAPKAAPPEAATPPVTPVAAPAPAPTPVARAAADPIREVVLKARGSELAFTVREPGAHELGRAKNAALRIDHPTVSRRQARIVLSADRFQATLEHAGSATATYLNDTVVVAAIVLGSGDTIRFGAITLDVVVDRERSVRA